MAIYVFGGVVIHHFALALLLGVIVGTYSSVFIASPLIYIWRSRARPTAVRGGAAKQSATPLRA